MDCIFCKIIKGEIPGHKVYEDDQVLAFLDITPVSKGHTLVVPKEHTDNLLTMSEEQIKQVFLAVQKIAKKIDEVLKPDGINLGMNNKPGAGQVIFHAHVHLMPRYANDGLKLWGKNYDYQEDEAMALAEKLRKIGNL
ncbi:MAG: HIT family protein [bacterium]